MRKLVVGALVFQWIVLAVALAWSVAGCASTPPPFRFEGDIDRGCWKATEDSEWECSPKCAAAPYGCDEIVVCCNDDGRPCVVPLVGCVEKLPE